MNYNQDFEAAKNWYKIAKEQNNRQSIDILEQLFPKLKDIYIVDTLVSICNMALPDIFKKYGCNKDDVLEWLNSQYDKNMSLTDILNNNIPKRRATGVLKEMIDEANNTAYKPKFSKGDYIIRNTDGYIHNTYYIKDVMDDYYVCTELSCKYNITFSFEEVDNTFKLWDISDAKDGDVIVHNSITFIFMGIENGIVKGICTELNDTILNFGEPKYDDDYYPATKEQRDTFFAKMKEDGYEWDVNKLKLKKIEQKSTNENLTDVDHEYYSKLLSNDNSDNIDKYAYQCAYYMSHDWMKETATWEDIQKAVKLGAEWQKQKFAWSEEDKKRINRISDFIWKNRKGDTDEIYQQEQDVNWLKSLRPQSKNEWSEEDKEFINDLIGVFDGQQYQAHSDEEIVKWLKSIRLPYNREWNENDEEMLKSIIATCELACEDRDSSPARHLLQMQTDWLKSLKPQKQWKPSNAQMQSLKEACDKHWEPDGLDPLYTLYEQLKKFKEE